MKNTNKNMRFDDVIQPILSIHRRQGYDLQIITCV